MKFALLVLMACGQTGTHERLRPADLEYLGVWRTVKHADQQGRSGHGWGSFTYADGKFYASNVNQPNGSRENRVYITTIPTNPPVKIDWSNTDLSQINWRDVPVGQLHTGFVNVVGRLGHRDVHKTPDRKNLTMSDIYVEGGDLFYSVYRDYNVQNRSELQFGRFPSSLQGGNDDRAGLWRLVSDAGNKFRSQAVADWITPIPRNLANQYLNGRRLLVGASLTWRAAASNGPSAFAVNPDDFKENGNWKPMGGEVKATHLLSYVGADGHDGPEWWTGSNSIAGGLVVQSGDRVALAYWGRFGDPTKRKTYTTHAEFVRRYGFMSAQPPTGNQGYKSDFPPTKEEVSAANNADMTYETALRRWKAGEDITIPKPRIPYRNAIYLYDFVELAQGNNQNTAEPYAIIDITDLTYPHRTRILSGVAYDAERRYIYVCQKFTYQSTGVQPLIHVWKVKGDDGRETEPLPPQPQVRDRCVSIPLTAAEYQKLKRLAGEEDMQNYARRLLLSR